MTATTTATSRSSHGNGAHVILVVDDALDSLRMLCDALAAEGYVVLAARDADEALQRFALTVPDGVLLDAVMPGMDGFTLCRRLKDTPAWAHVPVVFMTGLSDTDQIIRGFASGGVDYVVKPLRIPEVLVRLATHVRNARATRQAQEAVDVAGLGVVVLDGQGRVAWRSPQAARWLEEAFADQPFPMEAAGDWRAGAHQPDQAGHQDLALALADGRQLLAPGAQAPAALRDASQDQGRQVCGCLGVSDTAITRVLEGCEGSDGERLAALQGQLRCGTNCGSCLPELKRMVRATGPLASKPLAQATI